MQFLKDCQYYFLFSFFNSPILKKNICTRISNHHLIKITINNIDRIYDKYRNNLCAN